MIVKVCGAPKGGGSARGAVEYILSEKLEQQVAQPSQGSIGYAMRAKAADPAASYEALVAESLARDDLGVGTVWSPTSGEGRRPSAILALNVGSLATAGLEITATASANARVQADVYHLVISWRAEEWHLGDEDLLHASRSTLDRVGLGEHQMVLAVHRDTDEAHVHVTVGRVHPTTGQGFNATMFHRRLHWALREEEIARGWMHDHGLAVAREAPDGTTRVEWATPTELRAWSRERREERERAYRSHGAYESRDEKFERYVDATVAPRLRAADEREAGAKSGDGQRWSELHLAAARYGVAIEPGERPGEAVIRDASTMGVWAQFEAREKLIREKYAGNAEKRDARDEELRALYAARQKALVEEADRLRRDGEQHTVQIGDDQYRSPEETEALLIDEIERRPQIVSAAITRGRSTFTRADLDGWLSARITDPDVRERLSQHIEKRDRTLVMLEVDGEHPHFSTQQIVDVERKALEDARSLAATPVRFDRRVMEAAITLVEQRRGHALSAEQRELLSHLDRQLVVGQGRAGTGKTTVMEVVQVYGRLMGREVQGLTLSQAAAERLQHEAGFRSVNTTLGRMQDAKAAEATACEAVPRRMQAAAIVGRYLVASGADLEHLRREVAAHAPSDADVDRYYAESHHALRKMEALAARKALRDTIRNVERGYSSSNSAEAEQMRRDVVTGPVIERYLAGQPLVQLSDAKNLVIKPGGITVVDEAGMVDSAQMQWVLETARERGTTIIAMGGLSQLQPIGPGSGMRIVAQAAQEHCTYVQLHDIRRQRADWHREAVVDFEDALDAARLSRDEERQLFELSTAPPKYIAHLRARVCETNGLDAEGRDANGVVPPKEQLKVADGAELTKALIARGVKALDAHGAIEWCDSRDETIDLAVSASTRDDDSILIASDHDTVRHSNEQAQKNAGRDKAGKWYATADGRRQFAVGDDVIFSRNEYRALNVRNGTRGVVTATGEHGVTVKLEDGRQLAVDLRRYQHLDHGYATTIHKAQGASVESAIAVVDRSATAELFHVAASRAKGDITIYVAKNNFGGEAKTVKQGGAAVTHDTGKNVDNINALIDHLAQRAGPKTTTLTYDEELRRTGGPDTTWARSVKQRTETDSQPDRKAYEAEMADRESAKTIEIERLAKQYAARAKAIPDGAQKLAAQIALGKEMQRAQADLIRRHAIVSIEAWRAQRDTQETALRVHREVRVGQQARRETPGTKPDPAGPAPAAGNGGKPSAALAGATPPNVMRPNTARGGRTRGR